MRPHLEYCATICSPNKEADIDAIERVQRVATKLVPSIRSLAYNKRLQIVGLTSLADRRARGDLIQLFKIQQGLNMVDWTVPPLPYASLNYTGPVASIRGPNSRLCKQVVKSLSSCICHKSYIKTIQ